MEHNRHASFFFSFIFGIVFWVCSTIAFAKKPMRKMNCSNEHLLLCWWLNHVQTRWCSYSWHAKYFCWTEYICLHSLCSIFAWLKCSILFVASFAFNIARLHLPIFIDANTESEQKKTNSNCIDQHRKKTFVSTVYIWFSSFHWHFLPSKQSCATAV